MSRSGIAVLAMLLVAACGSAGGGGKAAAPPSPTTVAAIEATPVSEAAATGDVGSRLVARLPLPGGPDYLAASGGLLWVKHDDGKLLGISPDSNKVRRTVKVARNPGARASHSLRRPRRPSSRCPTSRRSATRPDCP
jgi:hypothetical protein